MPRKKQRSSFDQVSEFDRGRIEAYRDCGLSVREIGSRVGRNQTTVMRISDRWMQEGTTDCRVRSHPLQCTTSRADRKIVRMAVTDRSVTSRTVAQHIQFVTHHPVSARTIRHRLQQSGLSARRPLLQGCGRQNGIVLTDESRFCLQHHDGRIRIWRHRGERMLNSYVMHRHTGPALGIMVCPTPCRENVIVRLLPDGQSKYPPTNQRVDKKKASRELAQDDLRELRPSSINDHDFIQLIEYFSRDREKCSLDKTMILIMMVDSGQRTMDEDGEHYVNASEVPATFIRPSLANLVNRLTEALQEVTAPRTYAPPMAPYDGTYPAENFFRQLEAVRNDIGYGSARLHELLTGEPLSFFNELNLASRSYDQARQTLVDLYPGTSEVTFSDFMLYRLTGQLSIGEYYRNKVKMGFKLGLTSPIITEALTESLSHQDRHLMRAVAPISLAEWYATITRIRGASSMAAQAEPPRRALSDHDNPYGIAGILKQQRPDDTLHPVQYYSRALRPHEKNYTITELECLAIIDKFLFANFFFVIDLPQWTTPSSPFHPDETEQQREARLNATRERATTSRGSETEQQREARLNATRERATTSRASETEQQLEARLKAKRERATTSRASETAEQRGDRLSAHIGITGNELADSLAKAGALGLPEARKYTTQLDKETSSIPSKPNACRIGNLMLHMTANPHKHETQPELHKALGLQIIEENSSLFDITIYTDGKQLETGLSGSGIAIYKDKILEKISFSYPRHLSVYKSELSAIDTALKDININLPHKIIIYSDSRAAIYTLQSCFSSQKPLLKSIAKSVNQLPANSTVTVQWLPAQVGIPGNELAALWQRLELLAYLKPENLAPN
ncbi:hypothetical protein LAZ67_X001129 [Cordylochernes scorpioides]|uniref:ribonuclease H n=1 Tax=Cordylochernes scorpioides TaxID=51811 RepID=A0ABY6LS74_9ARAC|nr:hypothetical protein LAZ67_X001129 [Cordylochernes scorpioides]